MTMTMVLGLLLNAGAVTTVAIENRSDQRVELASRQVPDHYMDSPRASLPAGAVDWIGSASGKIILPHDEADASVVTLRYMDRQGNGCAFTTTAVRHTNSWSKLKPSATPIGRGKCEASMGRTIGDFVYVIR